MDGSLLVDNEGLHGMVERCGSRDLTSGSHVVYIEGFQAGGGVGMVATYSGPDTGDDKMLMKSGQVGTPRGFRIATQDGRSWKTSGDTLRLNAGTAVRLEIYAGADVYKSGSGRVGLFVNGDRNKAVRHMGYIMYTHPFQANNFDFAWRLIKEGNGYQIYNDFGGGHWVGYDSGRDTIQIVGPNDPKRVTWTMDPSPPSQYVEISTPESRYYASCDPNTQSDPSQFTICMFRSGVGLESIPAINKAGRSSSNLEYLGKGRLSVVDLNSLGQFRAAVSATPDANYAWAIYGQLWIGVPGTYSLCITSDDGYFFIYLYFFFFS